MKPIIASMTLSGLLLVCVELNSQVLVPDSTQMVSNSDAVLTAHVQDSIRQQRSTYQQIRNEERMADVKEERAISKAKAKESRRVTTEANRAARESKKAMKMEKKAQRLRKQADRQAERAKEAREISDSNEER